MGPRYALYRKLPKFSQTKHDQKFKSFSIQTYDFLLSCLEINPSQRPKISDLLTNELFNYSPSTELDPIQPIHRRKVKAKIMVSTRHSPEPTGYLKIHSKKQTPTYKSVKKYSPINKKSIERSYLFPEISRRDSSLVTKPSSKYIKRMVEIKTDNRSTVKLKKTPIRNLNRNPSLSYEASIEKLITSGVGKSVLSNRHQDLQVKRGELLSHFQSNLILPHKYRVKKQETSKSNLRYTVVENSSSNIYK